MVCGDAINSLEITLILQPARIDVKIGPTRTHYVDLVFTWTFENSAGIIFTPLYTCRVMTIVKVLISLRKTTKRVIFD